MDARKIYMVELKEPQAGEERFNYFSSLVAIFKFFGSSRLGVKYTSIRSNCKLGDKPYENDKCIIRTGRLIKSERGKVIKD